jgi:hypothetical protein
MPKVVFRLFMGMPFQEENFKPKYYSVYIGDVILLVI